jgi:type III secretory pathway component EscR
LGKWVNNQRQDFKNERLSDQKIKLLEEFNIPYKEILKKYTEKQIDDFKVNAEEFSNEELLSMVEKKRVKFKRYSN